MYVVKTKKQLKIGLTFASEGYSVAPFCFCVLYPRRCVNKKQINLANGCFQNFRNSILDLKSYLMSRLLFLQIKKELIRIKQY